MRPPIPASRTIFVFALLLAVPGIGLEGACEENAAPAGPPRCEPPEELDLERQLKSGFRALAEARPVRAQTRFEAVLEEAPDHPEARAGLRLAQGGESGGDPADEPGPVEVPGAHQGEVLLAGLGLPVALAIESERYRYEELRAQRHRAKALGLTAESGAIPSYFRPRRDPSGETCGGERLYDFLDLVVLHDSRTADARDAFLELGDSGGSTHFTIEYDGTVYQNLDLELEANHTKLEVVDARSISIDLVNPVDSVNRGRLPEGVDAGVFPRPLSEFVHIHGEEIQQWGYTPQQIESLGLLLRELARLLPELPATVPASRGSSAVPRDVVPGAHADFSGILGHLHVSPRATDPGPGFDWEGLATTLRQPLPGP